VLRRCGDVPNDTFRLDDADGAKQRRALVEEDVQMTLETEYLVRHELGKLLGADYRGRFLCVACLGPLVRGALGTTYTKGQIERALYTVSRTLGALTHRHSFVCNQCGKTAPCLSAR
jgi:hypothetical protein